MVDNTVEEWRRMIVAEHRRAELDRLATGQEGCGCSDCQKLYQELDLSKFSSRVFRAAGWVIIRAKDKKLRDTISNAGPQPPGSVQPVTTSPPIEREGDGAVTSQITALAGQGLPTRAIAERLQEQGIEISYRTVARKLQAVLL